MAITTRSSNLFAAEDWKRLYTTFRTADFQSYDYETLRKSMVDYLRTYYPEDFNDYIESSEFVAMLDLLAFMGQSLAFRGDLNARENFLSTAERRDSVYRLANMLGYSPKRHKAASGLLKVISVNTTELLRDSNGRNLANQTIAWDDPTNLDWQEQFSIVMNAALQPGQRIGRPSGSLFVGEINHELYQFRLRPNLVPIFPFTANANGGSQPFEIYNIGLDTDRGIYEISPQASDALGFVFRNDGRGNGSANTGFFMGFKQGQLNNLDFTLSESLPNRLVGFNLANINNDDVWLFELSDAGGIIKEWQKVDNLKDSNVIYNSSSREQRNLYSVSSRVDDQIDMIFGDGIFSDIPVGKFRATVRVSNGLSYSIAPNQMQSISITVAYMSKQERIEGLTVRMALQYTVNNAEIREDITEIKANAPQYYYSQNRMINGQDYNVFPYTKFNEIAKIKAVNRTASGISRFFDIKDATGKYSSTNVFCDDGLIYRNYIKDGAQFTWINLSDIRNFIRNSVRTTILKKSSLHLYYDKYPKYSLPETVWIRGTAEVGVSTGYFGNFTYVAQAIGNSASNNRKFLKPGCLARFIAPPDQFFDVDGQLVNGEPTEDGQSTELWTTIISVKDDGTNNNRGLDDTGIGPIVINRNIPTGAIITEVYAPYSTALSQTLEQNIVQQIVTNQDFGLRYDSLLQEWQIITASNLDLEGEFSTSFAGNLTGNQLDSSWMIAMVNNGNNYTVYNRGLDYLFGSVLETRFYFDGRTRIYDPRLGRVIKDNVKILKYNTGPTGDFLAQDLILEINDVVSYPDGYRDDTIVKVTFADSNNDGVPDDPTIFDQVVGLNVTLNDLNKLVFFEKYLDYDNLERFRWKNSNEVSTRYATFSDIENNGKYSNPINTVFYAYEDQAFFVLRLIDEVRTIVSSSDYIVRVGRSNLKFQYKHNSPNDRRIDPSPSNIIDMYILTSAYDREYRRYLADLTNTVSKPIPPTVVDMAVAFQELNNFKATSDAIVYNPVSYKSLFGSKADENLQATFKVVRSDNSRMTNTQIRNGIVNAINDYFSLENWDFGDTFYFSELAAYLHKELSPDVASVVIVPKKNTLQFGDFMQIRSRADEIMVSSATVDDVELIDAITASRLKAIPSSNVSSGSASQTRTSLGGF